MDETSDPFRGVRDRLAHLLPGYRLDPAPVSSTGMSQVYLAADARLHHRRVAVKAMAGYLSAHPAYRKRFLREIQLLAGLEHPNIMYVITAASPQDELLYLVMPRAEADLKGLLKGGPIDMARTVEIVGSVARALDYAHDRGVVHRDVKPGNILFGTEGHVYLSDFGVAKERFGEDLTLPGQTVGTRRYTAPEVFTAPAAEERPDDARRLPATLHERAGDVYSLGAVLFHCLTGQRPFDHLDDSSAEAAQRRGELQPVSEIRPGLPAALDALVAKAMHLDPAQRHRTCGELAYALAQTIGVAEAGAALPILRDIQQRLRAPQPDSTATSVAPVFAAPPPPPAGRAPRLLSALTSVVALLVLAGVLVFTAFDSDDDDGGAQAGGATTPAATASATEGAATDGAEPAAPDPVTGTEQAERRPVAGECLADTDDYLVVACDNEKAAKYVYRVVLLPEDPNPAQPEHQDAAYAACLHEDAIDFHYYWRDTADETDEPWDPQTGTIYYFICYQYV